MHAHHALFVAVKMTADVHLDGKADGPMFLDGHVYNFDESRAAKLIEAGDATFVSVILSGPVDGERPHPTKEVDDLTARMRSIAPTPKVLP